MNDASASVLSMGGEENREPRQARNSGADKMRIELH